MIDEQSEHCFIIREAEGHDEHNNQSDKIRLTVRTQQLGCKTLILLLCRSRVMNRSST
ncbi:hypothetical protein D3C75_1055760 [compost metagenome]